MPELLTLDESWSRALAFVAHPDDLEYGAASAIARWRDQGKSVAYVIASHGEAGIADLDPARAGPLRAEEQRRSAAIVGVEDVELLDYPDGTICYGLDLRRSVAAAVRRHRPQVLLTLTHRLELSGGRSNQADHRAVGLAVIDGVRDAANPWVFRELTSSGLAPFGGVRMLLFAASPAPTHVVDVTGTIERGIESLRAHATYLSSLEGPDPTERLRETAAELGRSVGTPYALSFEVRVP